jgi:kynurenine 3-monooxygenase
MSISYRGWQALAAIHLKTALTAWATASYGRITYDAAGNSYKQHYGNDDEAIDTIDRKILNTHLIDSATAFEHCHIHYDSTLEQIDFIGKTVNICKRSTIETHQYDYLFATDGVFSKSRQEYEKFLNIAPQIKQLPIGYKEFIIPYTIVEKLHWDKSFVHVWPTESANFVALPADSKQSFMGNLFCTNEWVDFFTRTPNPTKPEIIEFLSPQFPLLIKVLKELSTDCFTEPSASMYGTHSDHWNYQDNFLLLGDAIHGMAPFYAMGMNTCFG